MSVINPDHFLSVVVVAEIQSQTSGAHDVQSVVVYALMGELDENLY